MRKILAAVSAIVLTGSVNAGLIGSNVTANYYYPNLTSLLHADTALVAAGPEWVDPTGYPGDFEAFDSIDISDDSILFDFRADACCVWTSSVSFNGFEFIFDPGTLDDLLSVKFVSNSDGYVDSMLSVVNDTLFVNWQGGGLLGVESVEITLSFADGAVPTPTPLVLLGAGLIAMRLTNRKR